MNVADGKHLAQGEGYQLRECVCGHGHRDCKAAQAGVVFLFLLPLKRTHQPFNGRVVKWTFSLTKLTGQTINPLALRAVEQRVVEPRRASNDIKRSQSRRLIPISASASQCFAGMSAWSAAMDFACSK
jgi:hypothetical protein